MPRKSDETVIACALIPRFTLLAVVGGRRELLLQAMALAPEPGGPQVGGEASGPAGGVGAGGGVRRAGRDAAGRGAGALPRADPGAPGSGAGGGDLGRRPPPPGG